MSDLFEQSVNSYTSSPSANNITISNINESSEVLQLLPLQTEVTSLPISSNTRYFDCLTILVFTVICQQARVF